MPEQFKQNIEGHQLKPMSDAQVSDLRSDFVPFGGLVTDSLPDISEVGDSTQIIVETGGHQLLYMAVDGAWKLVSVLTPTWDDLRFPASVGQLGGANPADEQAYQSGLVLAFDSAVDEFAYFNALLPHTWIEGTNLQPHLHLIMPADGNDDGTADNVVFKLTYSWANINEPFPTATTITGTLDVDTAKQDSHMILSFPEINGKGKKISSILIMSIYRDVSEDSYGSDIYLAEFDLHYQRRAFGSEETFERLIIG